MSTHPAGMSDGDWDEAADEFYEDTEEPYCYRCDNKGFIIACPDDMCRGSGGCIHGDGEVVCPDCKGANADW